MSEKRSEPNSPTTSDQPLETTTTTPESASHGHTQGVSFNTDSFEIQASYTIPFAPPHIIKEIEGTCPGYGAKVLDYAIDEQRHRQKLDIRLEDRLDAIERRKDRELERRSELNMIGLKRRYSIMGRGQIYALISLLATLTFSYFLFINGGVPGKVGATIFAGVHLVAVIAAFLAPATNLTGKASSASQAKAGSKAMGSSDEKAEETN